MKFFLDTANIDEIKKGVEWGIVDGVTTNPTLVAREGREMEEVIREISKIVKGPISAEAVSTNAEEIVEEARRLNKLGPNIAVKIPITTEGLKATKKLSNEGIKVNTTLVFSVNQALLAAKAGASFASPFIGRLDDAGHDGVKLVEDIKKVYNNYGFKTEIIAASIRHPKHVVQVALAGADIATIPFKVLEKMFVHPLTDQGIKRFMDDWNRLQKELKTTTKN